jgi:hypothetical protein
MLYCYPSYFKNIVKNNALRPVTYEAITNF